jgi:hypothetical protein
MPKPREVWRHNKYYLDDAGWHRKYLLVLATGGGDVVYRLLTSRVNGRPTNPPCFHGDVYPSFYLGIPPAQGLGRPTWLDLRLADDMELLDFERLRANGVLAYTDTIPGSLMCDALLCAAQAPDTTMLQRKRMFDMRVVLGCP